MLPLDVRTGQFGSRSRNIVLANALQPKIRITLQRTTVTHRNSCWLQTDVLWGRDIRFQGCRTHWSEAKVDARTKRDKTCGGFKRWLHWSTRRKREFLRPMNLGCQAWLLGTTSLANGEFPSPNQGSSLGYSHQGYSVPTKVQHGALQVVMSTVCPIQSR